MNVKLSDETIAHIAKIIQVAILTGTDIVDNLRMIDLFDENGSLKLDPKYAAGFDKSVDKMLEEIASQQENSIAES